MIDNAILNPNPVGPNKTRYAMMGFLIGVALTLAVVVLADIMDTTIRTEGFLTANYEEVPLLAVIPPTNANSSKYSNYSYKESSKDTAGGAQ